MRRKCLPVLRASSARGIRQSYEAGNSLPTPGGCAEPALSIQGLGRPGEPEPLIPKISQETLAEMIGTTRSRVSFFMNRFRKLGFVEYDGRIRVHKSLLNVVLHDHLQDVNAGRRTISTIPTE